MPSVSRGIPLLLGLIISLTSFPCICGEVEVVSLMLTNPNLVRPLLATDDLVDTHKVRFVPRQAPPGGNIDTAFDHYTSPFSSVDVLTTLDGNGMESALMDADVTIDLTALVAEEGLESALPPALMAEARGYNGQIRRLPLSGGINKLICNGTRLAQAGWTMPASWEDGQPLSETWEGFLEILEQARATSADKRPQLISVQDQTQLLTILLLSMGGKESVRSLVRGKESFNSKLVDDWLSALEQLRPHVLLLGARGAAEAVLRGEATCTYAPLSLLNTYPWYPRPSDNVIISTFPLPKGYSLSQGPGTWLKLPAVATTLWVVGIRDVFNDNGETIVNYFRDIIKSEKAFYSGVTPATRWTPGPFHHLVPAEIYTSLPDQFGHVKFASSVLQHASAIIPPAAISAHVALQDRFVELGRELFQDVFGVFTNTKLGDPLPAFNKQNFTKRLEMTRLTEVQSITPPPEMIVTEDASGKVIVEIIPADSAEYVRYTIDGTPPGPGSPLYTNPLEFERDGDVLIRATSRRNGLASSTEVTRVISIAADNNASGTSSTVATFVIIFAVIIFIILAVSLGYMAMKWTRARKSKRDLEQQAEEARQENQNNLEKLVNELRIEISRREEAELLLKRESAFKSQFIGNMSHELRTPISGIQLGVGLLDMSNLSEHQSTIVKTIGTSVGLLLGLVNDILDATEIDEGGLQMRYRLVDLREVVYRCVNILETRAHERNIVLAVFIHPDTPREAVSDGDRLGQCLINLLTNAIKFTPPGGAVVLTVSYNRASCAASIRRGESSPLEVKPPEWYYDGACASSAPLTKSGRRGSGAAEGRYLGPEYPTGALVVEVRDTGMGIPESAHSRLFQRFSQVDPSDKRSHGGSGLGLYICKELLQRLGGGIAVKSRVDIGSTFELWVPVHSAPEELESASISSQTASPIMSPALGRALARVKAGAGRKPVVAIMLGNRIRSTIACAFIQSHFKNNVDLLEIHTDPDLQGTAATPGLRHSSLPIGADAGPIVEAIRSRGVATMRDGRQELINLPPWPSEEMNSSTAPLGKLVTTVTIRARSLPDALRQCKVQDILPSVVILAEDLVTIDDYSKVCHQSFAGAGPFLVLAKVAMKQSSLPQDPDDGEIVQRIDLPLEEGSLATAVNFLLAKWTERETRRLPQSSPLARRRRASVTRSIDHHQSTASLDDVPINVAASLDVNMRGLDDLIPRPTTTEGTGTDDGDELGARWTRGSNASAVSANSTLREGTPPPPSLAHISTLDDGDDDNDDGDEGEENGRGDHAVPTSDPAKTSRGTTPSITDGTISPPNGNEVRVLSSKPPKSPSTVVTTKDGTAAGDEEAPRELIVLMAEDNPVNARLLGKVVGKFNATAVHAWNGQEAFDKYKESPEKFDVVFMDLQMPVCTGRESTLLIRAHEQEHGLKPIPIHALTATTISDEIRTDLTESGFDSIQGKPIMIPVVRKLLNSTREAIVKAEAENVTS